MIGIYAKTEVAVEVSVDAPNILVGDHENGEQNDLQSDEYHVEPEENGERKLAMSVKDTTEFPPEVAAGLLRLDEASRHLQEQFKSKKEICRSADFENLDSLLKAKANLAHLFALHSAFWVYLHLRGEDPKSHKVRADMSRIQSLMSQVNDIESRRKMARLDVPAAERFIKGGLRWSNKRPAEEENEGEEGSEVPTKTSKPNDS
ncbi:unnamed protein product [Notodromas monacha]|uniref:Nuclear nucleic acid-binding protein C1D n=1 Tax=Notodromas monacha TaxID=399045 RepID=A0A7R9BEX9_9CRUS|nr:unnamed protein product [Notodromas monacha]CAG0913416.1 unnamed protein product [Notodromas monacha]